MTINEIINFARNPKDFIEKTEEDFSNKVKMLAADIISDKKNKIVLVAGPSAAGKTTTSSLLQNALKKAGHPSSTVSLDNFYGGDHEKPTLPDGRPDFESVYSLDLNALERFFSDILSKNKAQMPVFDFLKHKRSSNKELIDLSDEGILIVEGLHALNPVITQNLLSDNLFKIYISINASIYDDENNELLSSRQIRLARRLSRDAVYRASGAFNTLRLWTAVVRGEEQYLYKFKSSADVVFSTIHYYEPCIFKKRVCSLLKDLPKNAENYEYAMQLNDALIRFPDIAEEMIPPASLLHEFL